jgi:hypothetical protein
MLCLDMPLEHTFAREQTVILTALPFAFEISVILGVPRRHVFSMRIIMIALGREQNTHFLLVVRRRERHGIFVWLGSVLASSDSD